MRTGNLQSILSAFRTEGVLALALAVAVPSSAMAAKPRYTPQWANSISELAPNQSFLDHWSEDDDSAVDGSLILDAKSSAEMRVRYEDLSRNYNMRERYGIASTNYDDRDYHGQAEGFSRHLFRMILSYQMQKRLKKAEKNSSEVRTFTTVQKAAEKVTIQVDENIRLGTKTDLPGQKGRLWMTTPYVNGALDIDFGAPWEDPSQANFKTLDPTRTARDRYRVSLNRSLPVFDLHSSLSYGFSSTMMTATLSKALLAGLSCELLTRRGLDQVSSGLDSSEEAVKLLYNIRF